MAFRTDGFARSASVEDLPAATADVPSRTVASTLLPPATAAPAIDVVIQSIYLGGAESPSAPLSAELVGADRTTLRFEARQGVGGPSYPYAAATIGDASLGLENAFVPQPEGTLVWESVIHVLGLPPSAGP